MSMYQTMEYRGREGKNKYYTTRPKSWGDRPASRSDDFAPNEILFLRLFYVALWCSLVYLCVNFTCYIVPDGSVIYFKTYGVVVAYFKA